MCKWNSTEFKNKILFYKEIFKYNVVYEKILRLWPVSANHIFWHLIIFNIHLKEYEYEKSSARKKFRGEEGEGVKAWNRVLTAWKWL